MTIEKSTPVDGEAKKVDTSKILAPVIVDLGSAKKSEIKGLSRGQGELTERVLSVLEELRSDGTINGSAQPVIVVVKRKSSAKGLLGQFL
jgi:hypothetical protein